MDPDQQVILALVAILASAIGALVFTIKNGGTVKEAAKSAEAANQAVNNVGPGEHRLYDMIAMMREEIKYLHDQQVNFAEKGWHNLPPDMHDSVALTSTIRDLQRSDKSVIDKLKDIEDALTTHTEWEMSAKYETDKVIKAKIKEVLKEQHD